MSPPVDRATKRRSVPGPSPRFRRLIGESGVYTLGNVLRRAFSLITMPLFTRYLSTSGYGVLAIAGTLNNLLEVTYEMGLASAATRHYYNHDDEDKRVLFGTLALLSLGASLALTLVLLVAGPWVWAWTGNDIPYYPYIPVVIATVLLWTLGILPRVLFRVQNQAAKFLWLSTAQTALSVGLSVLFLIWLDLGPFGPILGAFVATAVIGVVYTRYLWRHIRLTFRWPLARQALAFGLPQLPTHLGGWALALVDRLILQHLTSLSVVAVYSVGYSISKLPFDLVANGIHWAIVPFFYQTATTLPEATSKAIFARVATYNIAVLAALGLFTVLFGPELIVLLASVRYAEASTLLPVLVAAAFLQSVLTIPTKGLFLMSKTAYMLPIVLGSAVVNVALNFALIPRYGMMGAAWATFIAYALQISICFVVSQRVYFIPYDVRRIATVVCSAFACAALREVIPDHSMFVRLGIKGAVLASFPVVLYLAGFFEAREVDWLRQHAAALVGVGSRV